MRLSLYIILLFTLTQLIACGGGSSSEVVDNNQAPIANAGSNQHIDENTQVVLKGSATDADGLIDSYQWTQIGGMTVSLENANSKNVSFLAPEVMMEQGNELLTFELEVTDNCDGIKR